MYKTMYELLTGYAPLTALVPVERIYETGSVEDHPEMPYVVLVWLPKVDKGRRNYTNAFEVHAHDERGSHARLRSICQAVKDRLDGVAQYQGSDGYITQCDYVGDGGEIYDSEAKTNLQFTSWEVVGRTI